MDLLSVFDVPAKVNLFLNISSKRKDSYHEIQSLFHTVALYDEMIVKKKESFRLSFDKSSTVAIKTSLYDLTKNNLLEKIHTYFQQQYQTTPVEIKLKKQIPVGAGLGGGSSDAAGLIVALDQLFDLKLSIAEKIKIGLLFGTDICFFFYGGLAWVNGMGEKIDPIQTNITANVLLVYPDIFVSTATAYRNYVSYREINFFEKKKLLSQLLNTHTHDSQNLLSAILDDYCYNAFEEKLWQNYGKIKKTYDTLKKKYPYTLLSGSGSTFFALSTEKIDHQKYSEKKHHVINTHLTGEGIIVC